MKLNSLARRLGLGLIQKAEQQVGWHLSNADANKIYMFHSIDEDFDSLHDCSITIDSFKKWLERVVEREEFHPLNSLGMVHGGSFVTFDDAFQSVADNAVPLLESYRIPFTCFVATDFIGKSGYLSLSSLRELADNDLCTIGSHTLTHPLLSACDQEQSRNEIETSREKLQEILGRPVDLFAYPYGSFYACSKINIEHARSAGYEFAFSTVNRPVGNLKKENRWYLPRINVIESNWKQY